MPVCFDDTRQLQRMSDDDSCSSGWLTAGLWQLTAGHQTICAKSDIPATSHHHNQYWILEQLLNHSNTHKQSREIHVILPVHLHGRKYKLCYYSPILQPRPSCLAYDIFPPKHETIVSPTACTHPCLVHVWVWHTTTTTMSRSCCTIIIFIWGNCLYYWECDI